MPTTHFEIATANYNHPMGDIEAPTHTTEAFEDEWDDIDWEIYDSAQILNSPFHNHLEPPQLLINIITEMGRSLGFDVSTPDKIRELTRQVLTVESDSVAPMKNEHSTEQPVIRAIPLNTKAERQAKKRQRHARKRNRR